MAQQPVYKYSDNYVASFKHLRDLKTDLKTTSDAAYKAKTSMESKIQDATGNAAISCDSSRYISIKSNGNKLGDILEDEVNQGLTINSYNKRMNFVSNQPQSLYVNSKDALFNYKFTGNSDITTPLATNYGQIQLAPSGVTTLNPAPTLISSRVNGLGSVGALYLDSTYGQVQTPLAIAPQSLSDTNANQLLMYRSTATGFPVKNQFSGKTGYATTQTSAESNEFLTKALADSLYSAQTGSLPDQIKTTDSTTKVQAKLTGVEISDDATLIATISKNSNATQIKGELDGIVLATNDLTIKTKDGLSTVATINSTQIQTTGSILQNNAQGSLPGHLTRRDFVENAIATAKGEITQIVDSNQADGNKYKLQITNNQLEFFRGASSEDLYMKIFGTADIDGVVQRTNKSRFFLESENDGDNENYLMLRGSPDAPTNQFYSKAGILSLRYGYINDATPNQYCSVVAQSAEAGSSSTRMVLYPKNTNNNAEITNQITFNARIGYEAGSSYTQNSDSILCRSENDARYISTSTPISSLEAATQSVNLGSQKIVSLAPGTNQSDAINLQQLELSRQAVSVARKTTTNGITSGQKVTGFVSTYDLNSGSTCYFDSANQAFLVTTSQQPTVRVKFRGSIKYQMNTLFDSAQLVLRDFSSNVSYSETLTQCNSTELAQRTFEVFKEFSSNAFVGLFVQSASGSSIFANLDIQLVGENIFTAVGASSLDKLQNSSATVSVSVNQTGLLADQIGQVWNLNGGQIHGAGEQTYSTTSGQALTRKDYVDSFTTQQNGYQFKPLSNTNSFGVQKISDQTIPLMIQTDLGSATTITVQNDLRLDYFGTKTLTDYSLMRRSDVAAMIAQAGVRQSYVAYVKVGDYFPDAVFNWDSSPSGLISSVSRSQGGSIYSIDINHSAIPFRHRVFLQKYSTTFDSADNDEATQYWIALDGENNINRTQTRIAYEYINESSTQNIGFSLMWVQW